LFHAEPRPQNVNFKSGGTKWLRPSVVCGKDKPMANSPISNALREHEIPGRVAVAGGNGGMPKVVVTTQFSSMEIYRHGAHITHFQKNGEPPLLFVSRQSHFAAGQPIRGGVPICFP